MHAVRIGVFSFDDMQRRAVQSVALRTGLGDAKLAQYGTERQATGDESHERVVIGERMAARGEAERCGGSGNSGVERTGDTLQRRLSSPAGDMDLTRCERPSADGADGLIVSGDGDDSSR